MKNIIRVILFSAFFVLFSSAASAEPVTYQGCLPPEVNAEFRTMSADEAQKPLTNQKLLTILIEFNDVKIQYGTEFWSKQMFDTTPNALSVVNYWKENSNGLDVFEPANTSKVIVGDKGIISYEDYHNINYEIKECYNGVVGVYLDMPHPVKKRSESDGTETGKTGILAIKALENHFDFKAEIPHFVTIFAGYEYPYGEGIGQVAAYTQIANITTSDGIELGGFTVQGELQDDDDIPNGIGTACHELGHLVFGLPDLYFSMYPSGPSDGVIVYSLMSLGCWGNRWSFMDTVKYDDPYAGYLGHVPTHLDPWCKIKCGFVKPTLVSDWEGEINSISEQVPDKYNVIKVQSKADPKQYFLIENRQLIGFDKGLETLSGNYSNEWWNTETHFNGGIIIYHIDENVDFNHNNNSLTHRFICIERSNNGNGSEPGASEWAYLNKERRNKFNTETMPNSNFHKVDILESCLQNSGCHPQTVKSGISIEVLSESSPSMRVKVNVDDEYKIKETGERFSDVFPDINFCNAIIEILSEDGTERNPNDVISTEDWFKILSIDDLTVSNKNIKSLQGIEHFSKLDALDCSNNELAELDFSDNLELRWLDCKNNKLTELNLSNCQTLMYLYCDNNLLKKFNLVNSKNLQWLYCTDNQLTKLDISQNPNLNRIHCYNNYMGDKIDNAILYGENNIKLISEPGSKDNKKKFTYYPQKTLGWKYACENMSAGGDITVSYDSLTVSDFDVILALYKDNRLINLSESNQDEKSASLVLPSEFESGNGWSVKAFVWDSVSSMLPLDGAFEKEL